MNGDEQGGANMAKMILGIVLIASGNILAINGYPKVPNVTLPAHMMPLAGGSGIPDVAALSEMLPNYFKLLMFALALVNVGAVFLYQCREPKQS